MSNGSDIIASELMTGLLTDEDVTVPDIDLTGEEFDIPGGIDNPLYGQINKLTTADLTTKLVDGTGVFDTLMTSFGAHLKAEFDANRIAGVEYTKAYIAMVQSAMAGSIQFLLGKDTAYWQAQQGQIAAITAKVQLATAKVQHAGMKFEALTNKSSYALTKLKLATEDANRAIAQYNLDNILNKQADLLLEQLNTQEQATLSAVKDNAIKDYNMSNLLPAQLALVTEQIEAQHAQTNDTHVDGSTPVTGLLGKQKDLYAQQIVSYVRDSEMKALKPFMDAFITMKSIDEGLDVPTNLQETALNTALGHVLINNNLD